MASEKSKYEQKRASGNQLYGPGCCAHETKVPRPPRLSQRDPDDFFTSKPSYWWQDEAHVNELHKRPTFSYTGRGYGR